MTENRNPSELAGAYALNALSSEDRAEYERYLATSREARREADSLENTAAALALDTPPVQPSAALRASVLAAIASTPQLPRDDAQQSDAVGEAPATPRAALAPNPGQQEQPVRPMAVPSSAPDRTPTTKASMPTSTKAQRKASRRWYTQPLAAAVAAVALVVTLLGVNGITTALNNGNGLPQALQLAQINAQPDAQRETVKLTNINDGEQVVATLVWSGRLGQSVLLVDGLASLTEEQTYELWYIRDDGPISAGTFNTTGSGDSWRVLDGTMGEGDAVGVTVEPAGGSEQPTTDPLLVIPTA